MVNFYFKPCAGIGTVCLKYIGVALMLLFATEMPFNLLAQAPVISYSTPQVYPVGNAIPTLAPSGSGVAALGYNMSTIAVDASYYFSYPFNGNANDASGNGNNGILQGAPSLTTDRFNNPNSAYSFNGVNQYISTTTAYAPTAAPQNFTISVWFKTSTPGGLLVGYTASQTGSASQYDRMLYMSNSGALYFGIFNGGVQTINTTQSYADGLWHHAVARCSTAFGLTLYVDEVQESSNRTFTMPDGYTVNGYWRIAYNNMDGWTNIPTNYFFTGSLDDISVTNDTGGFTVPIDVATDAKGNLYVTDANKGTVTELPAGGGARVVLGSDYDGPNGLGTDAAGNVYVADSFHNLVIKLPAGGGAPVTIGSGFRFPEDVAIDSAGNVYVADSDNSAIKKLTAGGGATIIISPQGVFTQFLTADAVGDVFFCRRH